MRKRSRRVFSEAQTRVMQHMVAHARPQADHILERVVTKPHTGSFGDDNSRRFIQPRMTISALVRKGMIENVDGNRHTFALTQKGREVAKRYVVRKES